MPSQRRRGDERIARLALWKKIELLKARTPATNDHPAGTWRAFAAYTGTSRETLRDGCPKNEDGTFVRQSITSTSEAILGQKYGFDPSCRTWTHGTPDDFATKWFPDPQDPFAPALDVVRVDEKIRSIDPEQRLTVALFMRRQIADPGNQIFDGELVCQVFTRIGVRLAVRRGILKITCRRDLVPPIATRLGGQDGVARFERNANSLTVTPSGQDHMQWGIETDRPPIGVISQELVDLFKAKGLREGDAFDVAFIVEDGDLLADEPQQSGSAVETVSDHAVTDSAVVTPSGASLGTNKRQLMAHIAKHSMNLFGKQRPGTAVLCSYAIRLVAAAPKIGERQQ